MKTFRVQFGCAVCLCVLALAGCNRRSTAQTEPKKAVDPIVPAESENPPPPGEGPSTSPSDLAKITQNVRPAIVLITVFDPAGKRITTGTGFFISEDGKIITSRHVIDGAVNAVAKAADGAIYNISGVLADAPSVDLALLRADVSKAVPFLALSKNAAEVGSRMTLVGSALASGQGTPIEETIFEKKTDSAGDWLDVTPPVPKRLSGWPLIDGRGEVVGIVSAPDGKSETGTVRVTNAIDALATQAASNASPGWPAVAENSPTPTPTPKPKGKTQLVYNPPPFYPSEAKRSRNPVRGSGRYRVSFDMNGAARNVEIVQSTGSQILDSAAVSRLREWKAAPGREWSVTVPVTFQP
jgi:TonB family protein